MCHLYWCNQSLNVILSKSTIKHGGPCLGLLDIWCEELYTDILYVMWWFFKIDAIPSVELQRTTYRKLIH